MNKTKGVKVMTPPFRANWVFLFQPREAKEVGKKPQYSVTCLFKKGENLDALKKAANAAIVEAWGADKAKWPKELKLPFKDQGTATRTKDDGTEFLPAGYEAGAIYFEAKSQIQPTVVDSKLNRIIDESEVYSGCYMRATVTFKAYDVSGKKGITVYLQNLQKIKDGDSLAGRTRAEDEFSAIEVDDTPAPVQESFEAIM